MYFYKSNLNWPACLIECEFHSYLTQIKWFPVDLSLPNKQRTRTTNYEPLQVHLNDVHEKLRNWTCANDVFEFYPKKKKELKHAINHIRSLFGIFICRFIYCVYKIKYAMSRLRSAWLLCMNMNMFSFFYRITNVICVDSVDVGRNNLLNKTQHEMNVKYTKYTQIKWENETRISLFYWKMFSA